MITLLVAQAAIYVMVPFNGVVPDYETECQTVLADRSSQSVMISVSNVGDVRTANVNLDGRDFQVRANVTSLGTNGSGQILNEDMILYDGDRPTFMFRFQYSQDGPTPVQTVEVLRFDENRHGSFFGNGLCWKEVSAQ